MFHKATKLKLKQGTKLDVKFQTGETKEYDMSLLFKKYPQLKALKNRKLFLKAKLTGAYLIIWNDDLDIDTETIYQEGKLIKKEEISLEMEVGLEIQKARARSHLTQAELSKLTKIDQSDISKIERGVANPSVATLYKIAQALDSYIKVSLY